MPEHDWEFIVVDVDIPGNLIYKCRNCDKIISISSTYPAPPKETP